MIRGVSPRGVADSPMSRPSWSCDGSATAGRQTTSGLRIGYDRIDRRRTRLSDGRMYQQRSSRNDAVCERTHVLPELRLPITTTRRRSSIFSACGHPAPSKRSWNNPGARSRRRAAVLIIRRSLAGCCCRSATALHGGSPCTSMCRRPAAPQRIASCSSLATSG